MAIGNKIFELRKASGMSQETLAEKLSISRQTVSKWESGLSAPDLDNILALSSLFNVSTDYLLLEDSLKGNATSNGNESVNGESVQPIAKSESAAEAHNSRIKKEMEDPPKTHHHRAWIIPIIVILASVIIACFSFVKKRQENVDSYTIRISDAATSVLYLELYDDVDNMVGTASGVPIDSNTIVTNYHVISEAYRIVTYNAEGNIESEIDSVLMYDENKDLAILRCRKDLSVPPLAIGNYDEVKQGDNVFAVGYPLGLSNTLSDGIVSSLYQDENGVEVIQITAPISPGSSGGALFNEGCEVVGIICASYVDGQNLNIAIAASEINDCMKDAEKSQSINLGDFYNRTLHPKSLQTVLDNKENWLEKEVIVQGYISSVDMPSQYIYSYCLVCTPEYVTGAILHGYPFRNEFEKYAHEFEWNLLSQQDAIELHSFPTLNTNFDYTAILPGMFVTVKGILKEVENAEALHDFTATTIILYNTEFLDWE